MGDSEKASSVEDWMKYFINEFVNGDSNVVDSEANKIGATHGPLDKRSKTKAEQKAYPNCSLTQIKSPLDERQVLDKASPRRERKPSRKSCKKRSGSNEGDYAAADALLHLNDSKNNSVTPSLPKMRWSITGNVSLSKVNIQRLINDKTGINGTRSAHPNVIVQPVRSDLRGVGNGTIHQSNRIPHHDFFPLDGMVTEVELPRKETAEGPSQNGNGRYFNQFYDEEPDEVFSEERMSPSKDSNSEDVDSDAALLVIDDREEANPQSPASRIDSGCRKDAVEAIKKTSVTHFVHTLEVKEPDIIPRLTPSLEIATPEDQSFLRNAETEVPRISPDCPLDAPCPLGSSNCLLSPQCEPHKSISSAPVLQDLIVDGVVDESELYFQKEYSHPLVVDTDAVAIDLTMVRNASVSSDAPIEDNDSPLAKDVTDSSEDLQAQHDPPEDIPEVQTFQEISGVPQTSEPAIVEQSFTFVDISDDELLSHEKSAESEVVRATSSPNSQSDREAEVSSSNLQLEVIERVDSVASVEANDSSRAKDLTESPSEDLEDQLGPPEDIPEVQTFPEISSVPAIVEQSVTFIDITGDDDLSCHEKSAESDVTRTPPSSPSSNQPDERVDREAEVSSSNLQLEVIDLTESSSHECSLETAISLSEPSSDCNQLIHVVSTSLISMTLSESDARAQVPPLENTENATDDVLLTEETNPETDPEVAPLHSHPDANICIAHDQTIPEALERIPTCLSADDEPHVAALSHAPAESTASMSTTSQKNLSSPPSARTAEEFSGQIDVIPETANSSGSQTPEASPKAWIQRATTTHSQVDGNLSGTTELIHIMGPRKNTSYDLLPELETPETTPNSNISTSPPSSQLTSSTLEQTDRFCPSEELTADHSLDDGGQERAKAQDNSVYDFEEEESSSVGPFVRRVSHSSAAPSRKNDDTAENPDSTTPETPSPVLIRPTPSSDLGEKHDLVVHDSASSPSEKADGEASDEQKEFLSISCRTPPSDFAQTDQLLPASQESNISSCGTPDSDSVGPFGHHRRNLVEYPPSRKKRLRPLSPSSDYASFGDSDPPQSHDSIPASSKTDCHQFDQPSELHCPRVVTRSKTKKPKGPSPEISRDFLSFFQRLDGRGRGRPVGSKNKPKKTMSSQSRRESAESSSSGIVNRFAGNQTVNPRVVLSRVPMEDILRYTAPREVARASSESSDYDDFDRRSDSTDADTRETDEMPPLRSRFESPPPLRKSPEPRIPSLFSILYRLESLREASPPPFIYTKRRDAPDFDREPDDSNGFRGFDERSIANSLETLRRYSGVERLRTWTSQIPAKRRRESKKQS